MANVIYLLFFYRRVVELQSDEQRSPQRVSFIVIEYSHSKSLASSSFNA